MFPGPRNIKSRLSLQLVFSIVDDVDSKRSAVVVRCYQRRLAEGMGFHYLREVVIIILDFFLSFFLSAFQFKKRKYGLRRYWVRIPVSRKRCLCLLPPTVVCQPLPMTLLECREFYAHVIRYVVFDINMVVAVITVRSVEKATSQCAVQHPQRNGDRLRSSKQERLVMARFFCSML